MLLESRNLMNIWGFRYASLCAPARHDCFYEESSDIGSYTFEQLPRANVAIIQRVNIAQGALYKYCNAKLC